MQKMSVAEIEMVNGGNPIALLGLAVAIIGSAEQIRDFTRGLIDGIAEAQ